MFGGGGFLLSQVHKLDICTFGTVQLFYGMLYCFEVSIFFNFSTIIVYNIGLSEMKLYFSKQR